MLKFAVILGILLFSISDGSAQDAVTYSQAQFHADSLAIARYYELLNAKKFEEAYDMLVHCDIMVTCGDMSDLNLLNRVDDEYWLGWQQKIKSVRLLWVSKFVLTGVPDHNAFNLLGIRTYMIRLHVELFDESAWPAGSGEYDSVVHTLEGNFGIVRLFGFGTGI